MFLKVLMLIRQGHPKNAMFATIGILCDKGLQFQSSVSNSFHDVLMMLIQIISIAVLNINDVDFCLNY